MPCPYSRSSHARVVPQGTLGHSATAFHSGGALTDLQDGFFGSTGSGVLKAPSLDAGASEHTKGLASGIQNGHVSPVYGHGLSGATSLYKGNCPEGHSVQQCIDDSLDPGTMWRPDSYAEFNTVLDMRGRFEKCKLLGYSGVALNKCAAPKAGE